MCKKDAEAAIHLETFLPQQGACLGFTSGRVHSGELAATIKGPDDGVACLSLAPPQLQSARQHFKSRGLGTSTSPL